MLLVLFFIFVFNMISVFVMDDSQTDVIDESSYKKMPELSNFNDYRDCVTTYKDDFKYCVTHVYIQLNQTSELWKYIEDFSSKTNQHYRHDVLKRGICMNDCWEKVKHVNLSSYFIPMLHEVNQYLIQPYPTRIGVQIPELKSTDEDFVYTNVCNNLETVENYGLQSISKVSFCLSQNGEDERQRGDWFDFVFFAIFTSIIGLICTMTVLNIFLEKYFPGHEATEYISCFCLRRNLYNLVHVEPSQSLLMAAIKLGPLGVLVCAHAFTGLNQFNVVDSFRVEDSVHRSSAAVVRSWQFFMPFFLIAGYFSSYSWIGKLVRNETHKSQGTMIKPLTRRLVRLMPSLGFVVFFFATKLYNFYSNPKWLEVVANSRVNCRENGWTNMLLLNNLVNNRHACMLQAWSIPAEMQLFFGTMCLKKILRKYPNHLFKILWFVYFATTILSIITCYLNNLHGLMIAIEPLRNDRYYDANFHLSYIHPLTYASSWTLGILLAAWSHKIQQTGVNIFKTMTARCAYSLSISTGIYIGSILSDQVLNVNAGAPLPLWLVTLICFARSFSILPCLVILNIDSRKKNKGQGSEKLLSKTATVDMKYFFWLIPLAKIGYCGYVSHFAVIYVLLGKYIENGEETEMNLFNYFFQIVIYSILSGTALKIAIEQPIFNLYQLITEKLEQSSDVKNKKRL